jgi:thiol-disulfide isomerase/thioredoxin
VIADRRPTRPLAALVAVAVLAAVVVIVVVALGGSSGGSTIARGQVVPNVTGTTLDGKAFDLTTLRGHPVLLNFWGPSCAPCVEEMPLLAKLAAAHAADGFQVVGVLTDDPVEPARAFVVDHGATWPTVIDPGGVLKRTYQVIGRPQSFYIDRNGIYRDYQIGQVTEAEFDRKYAEIVGGS